MPRKKISVLVSMVLLAFGAGLVVGWVWTPLQRVSAMPTTNPSGAPRPWFDQLGLSADQKSRIEQIWADARQQMQKQFDSRRDIDHQRDQQIRALLNADQLAAYEKISEEAHNSRMAADKHREAILADANEKTRALLDATQQQKWDILSKQMQHGGHHGGPGMQNHSTTGPDFGGPHQ